jgi:hypothetical protein
MTNAPTTTTRTTTGSSPSGGGGAGGDGGATDHVKSEARSVAETTKQAAGQVTDEAGSQAVGLARTAREEAQQRARGEVDKLAGFLGGIGDELNGIADGAPPTDGRLQGLARDGAQAANRLSHRLETGGLDGALNDVSMFARRRPGVFLAAAFGVGIALGRVTRNADMHAITESQQSGSQQSDSRHGGGSETEGSTTPAPPPPPAPPVPPVPPAPSASSSLGRQP